jgi:hypothetical protein
VHCSLSVGRKNYLFAGPKMVLAELPKRMSKTIDDLLPMNWNDPAVIILTSAVEFKKTSIIL